MGVRIRSEPADVPLHGGGELPAQRLNRSYRPIQSAARPGPLRILVIAAQPIGAGKLSVKEEQGLIRRAFPAADRRQPGQGRRGGGVTPQLLHELAVVGRRRWPRLRPYCILSAMASSIRKAASATCFSKDAAG